MEFAAETLQIKVEGAAEVENQALEEWKETSFNNGVERAAALRPFKSLYYFDIFEVANKDVTRGRNPAVPPPEMKLNVLSLTISVNLGRKLNVAEIVGKLKNVNYAYLPGAFIPLKMYLKKPRATALVFKSGSMIVTGMKTEEDGRIATRRFARIIQKTGCRVSVAGARVVNVTCRVDFGFKIRMTDLVKCPAFNGLFQPEVFNGYSFTAAPASNAKVTIFHTGQALITGVDQVKDAEAAMKFVYPFARLCAV